MDKDINKTDTNGKTFARFFIISALAHVFLFFIFLKSPFQAAERVNLPPSINVSIKTITPKLKRKNSIVKKKKEKSPTRKKKVIKKVVRKKKKKSVKKAKKNRVNLKKKKKNNTKKIAKKKNVKKKIPEKEPALSSVKRNDTKNGKGVKNIKEDTRKKLDDVYKRLRRRVKEESLIRETEISNKAKALGKLRAARIREYQNHIALIVEKNWSYNKQLSSNSGSLETRIVFKVMPDGSIKDIVFEKESADDYLNDSAYKAIIKSNPLSPHPKDINENFVLIPLKFTPSGIN